MVLPGWRTWLATCVLAALVGVGLAVGYARLADLGGGSTRSAPQSDPLPAPRESGTPGRTPVVDAASREEPSGTGSAERPRPSATKKAEKEKKAKHEKPAKREKDPKGRDKDVNKAIPSPDPTPTATATAEPGDEGDEGGTEPTPTPTADEGTASPSASG
jgi:hypothetical protein